MKFLLREALASRRLVCDGAMGTQLMLAGLEQGACGEAWNLSHPERVLAIQTRYADAGADCLITNTFGASPIMLRRHGHDGDVRGVNQAAVRIAREAFGGRPGFVLGDVGPLGPVMEPSGELPVAEAAVALREQISALVSAGADAILLETQTNLDEVGLGIDAAREAGATFIIASFAYDRSPDGTFYRTMMGVSPEQAAEFVQERGGDAVALNCGTGIDMAAAVEVVRLYRENGRLFTMAQPNAGLPVLENMKAVYKQTPEEMVDPLPALLAAGCNIIGSCCGSDPRHTAAIRRCVDNHAGVPS